MARQSSDETRVENVTGWIETGWPRSSRQPRPPDLRGLPHAGLPVAGRSDKRLGRGRRPALVADLRAGRAGPWRSPRSLPRLAPMRVALTFSRSRERFRYSQTGRSSRLRSCPHDDGNSCQLNSRRCRGLANRRCVAPATEASRRLTNRASAEGTSPQGTIQRFHSRPRHKPRSHRQPSPTHARQLQAVVRRPQLRVRLQRGRCAQSHVARGERTRGELVAQVTAPHNWPDEDGKLDGAPEELAGVIDIEQGETKYCHDRTITMKPRTSPPRKLLATARAPPHSINRCARSGSSRGKVRLCGAA